MATGPGAAMLRPHSEAPKEVRRAPDHHLQTAAPVNPVLDGFPLETGQEGTQCKARMRRRNYLINYTTMPKGWVINKRK